MPTSHRHEPIGGLPPIQKTPIFEGGLSDLELFDKQELAEALKAKPWQITRDSQLLWGTEIAHKPLTRSQCWTMYCVACFRRVQYLVFNRSNIRGEEILNFAKDWSESQILQLVESVGGSEKDFKGRMDTIILKRRIKKIN